ncbi:carbon starvation protein CstA [Alcaligenes faecalis subsp. faecalis NCIB 8687]|nr:carbon starvation protein CstA [Alcaligenes faecalis subsp. faecalis NCIB 8687]
MGLAIGIVIVAPDLKMPATTKFIDGTGPVWSGSLFPEDGDDAGQLLKNADMAMYAAKACGRCVTIAPWFHPGIATRKKPRKSCPFCAKPPNAAAALERVRWNKPLCRTPKPSATCWK